MTAAPAAKSAEAAAVARLQRTRRRPSLTIRAGRAGLSLKVATAVSVRPGRASRAAASGERDGAARSEPLSQRRANSSSVMGLKFGREEKPVDAALSGWRVFHATMRDCLEV